MRLEIIKFLLPLGDEPVNIFHSFVTRLIETHQYLGVYFGLALGILGLPIPDETLLTFVGYKIHQGKLNFLLAFAVAWLGSLSGMSLSYLLGQKLGIPFAQRYGKWMGLSEMKLHRGESWFLKYGSLTVIFGYFIPGLRHINAYFAGISRMNYPRFLWLAGLGAGAWVLLFLTLGNLIGERWQPMAHVIHRYLWILAAVFGLLCLVYFGPVKKWRKAYK